MLQGGIPTAAAAACYKMETEISAPLLARGLSLLFVVLLLTTLSQPIILFNAAT
jgi:hypothetical protein